MSRGDFVGFESDDVGEAKVFFFLIKKYKYTHAPSYSLFSLFQVLRVIRKLTGCSRIF